MDRIYFKNFDVLRFVAAYLIVLLHCFFGWKAFFGHPDIISSNLSPSLSEKLELIVNNFSFGVDIFFLVSGFLITYLLLAEKETTGRIDVMKFYIRRAFRIWPLYFVMILIGPLLAYFFYEQSPDYLYQFLFAGNFDVILHGTKSPATDHLWSICIEEHFYLVCPLMLFLIPVKRIPQTLLSIILICVAYRAYISSYSENYGMTIYMHTLSRIDVLAIGSLFGYLYYQNKIKLDSPLPVRLIIYALFLFIFLNVSYNECGSLFTATVKKYFYVLMAAYWIGNFLFNPDSRFVFTKPNFIHSLGKMSYGIYMFNPVVIFLVLKFFSVMEFRNYFMFLACVHLALWGVISLSYYLIELPFLSLKEKYAVIKSGTETVAATGSSSDEELIPALEKKEIVAEVIKAESTK
ncbi:MAG: acyltransferase family protein [Bacteroidia bacterium]